MAPPDLPREQLEPLVEHLAADSLACALSLASSRLGVTLARTAADFVRIEGWKPYGYARLGDYTREAMDRSGRWLRDLALLGDALRKMPDLELALWGGDGARPLGRIAATNLARVASEASASAWIALARRTTVRELQEAVRRARHAGSSHPEGDPGAPPTTATDATSSAPDLETDPTPAPAPRVLEAEVEEIESCEVKLGMPAEIRAAFEETLDLHRAVSGHQASIESFIEALTAEAAASFVPPDASLVRRLASAKERPAEEELAIDARVWQDLGIPVYPGIEIARELVGKMKDGPARGEAGVVVDMARHPAFGTGAPVPFDPTASNSRREMAAARTLLRHVEAVSQSAPSAEGPREVASLARRLQELVRLEDEIERRLGSLLAEMDRRCDWAGLHFKNLGHYAEQRLGMCRRTAERRAGIVRALRTRPLALAAYESRVIGLQAAWLLHGILRSGATDPKLERAWVERARSVTVKRLRDEARWVLLRDFRLLDQDLAAESPAAVGSPRPGTTSDPNPAPSPNGLRSRVPLPPADAAWHASLRRRPGISRRRIVRLGWRVLQPTRDNVFLRLHLSEDAANALLASIEAARRHLEETARAQADLPPGSAPSAAIARLWTRRGQPLPAWVGLLARLEDYVQTWDDPRSQPRRRWSPTYERDGYRCMAPGCTARCSIENHHIDYRSEMGSDEPWNQLCLCRFHHHQGEHGLLARCRGRAPLDVLWRLGRKDLATWYRNDRRLAPPTSDPDGEPSPQDREKAKEPVAA